MKRDQEFDNFDRTMRDLMNVSHEELKKELDAEKAVKTRKKQKAKNPSASDRAGGETD